MGTADGKNLRRHGQGNKECFFPSSLGYSNASFSVSGQVRAGAGLQMRAGPVMRNGHSGVYKEIHRFLRLVSATVDRTLYLYICFQAMVARYMDPGFLMVFLLLGGRVGGAPEEGLLVQVVAYCSTRS